MDETLKQLFSNNLKQLLLKNDKTQSDMCRFMNISSATASDWCNGKKMPRADKLQSLCTWLHCELNDLIGTPTEKTESNDYYLDPETRELAELLHSNSNYRILFDAAKDSRPEDLQMAADLLQRLKGTNPNG